MVVQDNILDFLRATENYKRADVVRVTNSTAAHDDTTTILEKADLQWHFEDAMKLAGPNPRVELCERLEAGDGAGIKPIVRYKSVHMFGSPRPFLD